jgi:isopentenyl phosphate kinase
MIFLKLGGSLITDKAKPETPRLEALQRLAEEIEEAIGASPGLRVLIGHGSGSFGHHAAARYSTHRGAADPQAWRGFAEVWAAAARLNRLVVDALREAGLPAMGFPPSASAICEAGEIREMAVEPIARAFDAGLLPVVAGDVAFDRLWGSTIISTEKVFAFLAPRLHPSRVLLAGIERGVYADFPRRKEVLPSLTKEDLGRIFLGGSSDTDVTGGMADKVELALALAAAVPGLEVRIFSGEVPGDVRAALSGAAPGTLLAV